MEQTGTLKIQIMDQSSVVDALKLLQKISESCRRGHIQIVQNSIGGHMTMTSTSCRLFQSMSVSKPCNRLIMAAVQGHQQHYSDGGHFISLLTTLLVTKSLTVPVSRSYLSDLYDHFLSIIIKHLTSERSKFMIDFSNLLQMTSFVKSILGTKPLCKLNQQNIQDISKILLQIFVNNFPTNNQPKSWEQNVHFICEEGLSVSDSRLFQGILIQANHIPESAIKRTQEDCGRITVAMVSISMTGDTEEVGGTTCEVSNKISTDRISLDRIRRFCDQCHEHNVKIILCQKVIHPIIKSHLNKLKVLYLDRLGSSKFQLLINMSGSKSLRYFSIQKTDIGELASIQNVTINKKNYIHLQHNTSAMVTVLLTNENEVSLQELKAVCVNTLHCISRLPYSPYVIPGGGCWEIAAACHLRYQVTSNILSLSKDFHCSKSVIITALDVCCSSLQSTAKTVLQDSEEWKICPYFPHVWRVPQDVTQGEITCSCGIYKTDVVILQDFDAKHNRLYTNRNLQNDYDIAIKQRKIVTDQLDMCVDAVKTSFLTANALLSTKLFIDEK